MTDADIFAEFQKGSGGRFPVADLESTGSPANTVSVSSKCLWLSSLEISTLLHQDYTSEAKL